MQVPSHGFTHAGKFHADEVFSTALLQILNPAFTVRRGFTVPQNFDGLVYDIGFGAFDHHQKNAPVRANGVKYAAFGLLWRQWGTLLMDETDAARFDEHFVQPLDKDDNTGCGHALADIVGAFNPAWDSSEDADAAFERAVSWAKTALQQKLGMVAAMRRGDAVVQQALEKMKNGIVYLDPYAPWKNVLIPSRAEFVVYPSARGGYSAQGVPRRFDEPTLKVPFPAAWAGADEAELPAISGIETLRFCHASRFLITAQTREDAVQACLAAREEARW